MSELNSSACVQILLTEEETTHQEWGNDWNASLF